MDFTSSIAGFAEFDKLFQDFWFVRASEHDRYCSDFSVVCKLKTEENSVKKENDESIEMSFILAQLLLGFFVFVIAWWVLKTRIEFC